MIRLRLTQPPASELYNLPVDRANGRPAKLVVGLGNGLLVPGTGEGDGRFVPYAILIRTTRQIVGDHARCRREGQDTDARLILRPRCSRGTGSEGT